MASAFLEAEKYTAPEIISGPDKRRKRYLPVNIGGVETRLEMRNVRDKSKDGPDVWIAYYDPRKHDLLTAGVKVLVPRLKYLDTDVIVTASSGKSTELLRQTRDRLSWETGKDIDLIVLERGDPEDPKLKANAGMAVYDRIYHPITAEGKDRQMIVSMPNFRKLNEHFLKGRKIAIVDDVYSSGETTQAIADCLNFSRAGIGMPHPQEILFDTVTVMRECEINPAGGMDIPHVPNLHTGIITPVIIGNLPPRPAEIAAI